MFDHFHRCDQIVSGKAKLADIALANLSIQTGRFGSEAETAYESMQRLRAAWNNFKEEAGKGLVAVIDVVYRFMQQGAAAGIKGEADLYGTGSPWYSGQPSYRGKITAERPYDPTSEGNLLRAEAERIAPGLHVVATPIGAVRDGRT